MCIRDRYQRRVREAHLAMLCLNPTSCPNIGSELEEDHAGLIQCEANGWPKRLGRRSGVKWLKSGARFVAPFKWPFENSCTLGRSYKNRNGARSAVAPIRGGRSLGGGSLNALEPVQPQTVRRPAPESRFSRILPALTLPARRGQRQGYCLSKLAPLEGASSPRRQASPSHVLLPAGPSPTWGEDDRDDVETPAIESAGSARAQDTASDDSPHTPYSPAQLQTLQRVSALACPTQLVLGLPQTAETAFTLANAYNAGRN
eukprot:TRINITY_DN12065_c0_g2_i1.p1 TRINITY_DN12065_c0_g2~~TRINITY_DN12065_c0_g2_i1.p1  ORF type:complete len:268 (+),score=22.65 TRINITY_DN12065_c0_g2_i1:29-805(+)